MGHVLSISFFIWMTLFLPHPLKLSVDNLLLLGHRIYGCNLVHEIHSSITKTTIICPLICFIINKPNFEIDIYFVSDNKPYHLYVVFYGPTHKSPSKLVTIILLFRCLQISCYKLTFTNCQIPNTFLISQIHNSQRSKDPYHVTLIKSQHLVYMSNKCVVIYLCNYKEKQKVTQK